ncbi:hypothetical protein B0H17DRAFT_1173808 [Mycena rosella]|uniref:Uncharacterized protein n=1 Tax=Mycena rosella TaxID=1033263 RepID=A0AAD7MBK4_MYCRO|nr:hypothetical protein B0H17DRAFT_1173808 [Mycena rosella]
MEFMGAHDLLKTYLQQGQAPDKHTIRVLFEATFDKKGNQIAESLKRGRIILEPGQGAADSEKIPKTDLDIPRPKGLCVLPPDTASPIDILSPSEYISPQSGILRPGIFVDKTEFIPPGTGKSALKITAASWYDIAWSAHSDIHRTLFHTLRERGDLVKMIKQIFDQASRKNAQLFIAVDHWDAPILKSFISNNRPATEIIDFDNISNISLHPDMKGAFGMSDKEVDSTFSVLSHCRRVRLQRGPELDRQLGCFSPPLIIDDDASPGAVYNFNFVLHYAASTLNLNNAHTTPPEVPLLVAVPRLCGGLLQNSSLRLEREMVLPLLHIHKITSSTPRLVEFATLWRLLFYLGALRVTSQTKDLKVNPLWALEVTSPYIRNQLFSGLPSVSRLYEPVREMRLRALLERNPIPLGEALAHIISPAVTPLRDLYEMGEVAIQIALNVYMSETGAYLNHYFTQVCLFNDSTKSQDENAKPGSGRFGYVDSVLLEVEALRPRRAVVVELKTAEKCRQFVKHEFKKKCLKKIQELNEMTMDDLRKVDFHYYSEGEKSNTVTIGTILDDAKEQLRAYMKAIAAGEGNRTAAAGPPATPTLHPTAPKPEGILDSIRIEVEEVRQGL